MDPESLTIRRVLTRRFSVDAAALITINFDCLSCRAGGPTHNGVSYIGTLLICPHNFTRMDVHARDSIAVAGAVAALYTENAGITGCAVHSRMTEQDCVLALIPTIVVDCSDLDILERTAREVARLLHDELADEWDEATESLIVSPDHFEAVYPRTFNGSGAAI